jgi:hypothetical protein
MPGNPRDMITAAETALSRAHRDRRSARRFWPATCPNDGLARRELRLRWLGKCKGARPNHVGAAIARHKRAGRIEERDGKLYATQSTDTEQR